MTDIAAVALETVTAAGALIRSAWTRPRQVGLKGPVDLVTETDREVEGFVVEALRRHFPRHRIVAEEGVNAEAPAPDHDDHVWYLDPLDGTTNFAHGFPHIAVSLALARGSELELGIVHDPLRHETFVARRGRGATLNGAPISVSPTADLGAALVATGFAYDRRAAGDFYLGFVADMLRQARDIRRAGSAALDLSYVACGRFDAYWEWRLKPWDTAAGTLLVREAGGTVSDLRGGTFDLHGDQILATNGKLHAAVSAVLAGRLDTMEARGEWLVVSG